MHRSVSLDNPVGDFDPRLSAPHAPSTHFYLKVEPLQTLRYHALRAVGLQLFRVNCATGNLRKAVRDLRFWIRRLHLPPKVRPELLEVLEQIVHEVGKWGEKHGAMFADPALSSNPAGTSTSTAVSRSVSISGAKRRTVPIIHRVHPSEHLRLYFDCIRWRGARILIDQFATCQAIMAACEDWPMMRFQLACTYALTDVLDTFDRIRLRCFQHKLQDHALYNFWFEYLKSDKDKTKTRLFLTNRLLPPQVTSLAFQWAIEHGHLELVTFLGAHFTDEQVEYLGLLHWRRISFQAKHVDIFEYLCERLCELNAYSMARVTWNSFYTSLFESLQVVVMRGEDKINSPEIIRQNLYKLRFLLAHCCPTLKWNLLMAQDCRALNAVFLYKDRMIWDLFVEYLSQEDLEKIHEYFDRIYHEEPSQDLLQFLNLIRMHINNDVDN